MLWPDPEDTPHNSVECTSECHNYALVALLFAPAPDAIKIIPNEKVRDEGK